MTPTPIRKAIFPVAGLGTRFLPATKASPKEMMAVVDKPLIQYAVEEAIAAGIDELIFVTSGEKRAIEDHFDKNYELEIKLEQKGKLSSLEVIRNIPPRQVSCVYIRQPEALGLGHAILCAKRLVGDEAFAVLLADDLICYSGHDGCLTQMVHEYQKAGVSVLATEMVSPDQTEKYGIVSIDKKRVCGIVEKPKLGESPSNQAVVGRYILPPEIFQALEKTNSDSTGEIQLTDAVSSILDTHHFTALPFKGTRYDCGSRLGYLQANLELGLQHPEVGKRWQAYLQKRLVELLS